MSNGNLKRIRPLRLDGLTLTNMNNNRGQRAITNREIVTTKAPALTDVPPRAALPSFPYSQKNFSDMFSAIVDIVRNRTGFGFTQAFNHVLRHNRDLFSGSPGFSAKYERTDCAQRLGKVLNRVERTTGLRPIAATERSSVAVGAICNRVAPQFSGVPTAFQWDLISRAAESLEQAGAARKLFNRAAQSISASDVSAANKKADDVLDFLTHSLDTIPNDIGALLQRKRAGARQIWLTFYYQIKRLIAENDMTTEQAFAQLKDEQPLFWTMAMLSFENGVTS